MMMTYLTYSSNRGHLASTKAISACAHDDLNVGHLEGDLLVATQVLVLRWPGDEVRMELAWQEQLHTISSYIISISKYISYNITYNSNIITS